MAETNACVKNGFISYDGFVKAANGLLKLAKEINDPWTLIGDSDEHGDSYLSVAYIKQFKDFENNDFSGESLNDLINCRYDVVYSLSYSVPVLYFMMSRSNGKPMTLKEVWKMNNIDSDFDMWNIVTQQDHPILHTPFFCVHPCHNSQLLSECFRGREPTPEEYLGSWLSIVGNTFGLKLSNHYSLLK